MSVALAEPLDAATTGDANPSIHANQGTARAEASRANGRLSHGPTTPEGKARSRQNGCKDGLTGAGTVLPPAAAVEVDRREAGFAREIRPRNEIERELVRQMALGAWRSQTLTLRIIHHEALMNTARFANWEQDEQLAAAELGRRLGDDPEAVLAQLRRSSAGCDWLIGRWRLLGNGLSTADEGGPNCAWTDADLALVLNLLGRPVELRHLDDWPVWLESLRQRVNLGSDEAVTTLRELIAEQVAGLEKRGQEAWEEIEQPQLRTWHAGLDIDLGPEGTRLRRYEAAADRLCRSAWTKLERLRKESGEPLLYPSARAPEPEPAPPPLPPAAPSAEPVPPTSEAECTECADPRPSLVGEPAATVLDAWVGGPPRTGTDGNLIPEDKTNPTRSTPVTQKRTLTGWPEARSGRPSSSSVPTARLGG